MKVLHLDSGREMRGGQWQALRLHAGLIAAGHDSHLLARAGSPLLEAARRRALPCAPLGFGVPGGYDLIHAHDAHSHTRCAIWSRSPFVVSRRVAFPVRTSFLSRAKYRRAARFLAVSRFVANQLIAAGIPASKIDVVWDGIPVPPAPAEGTAILAPWTLDPEKGMALAQAAAHRAGVHLELSKDLEADLPRARVLVYLTRSEGLGSGILLAMAHGVTVIASRVGGVPELIEDGVNGFLVDNNQPDFSRAFADDDRRIGRAARQTVLDHFTEAHMIQATLQAYSRVLDHA